MLKKIKIAHLALFLLLTGFSINSHAASDSTKIGISVIIKAKHSCGYDFNSTQLANSQNSYSHFSSCDMSTSQLQEHAELAIKTQKTLVSTNGGDNQLRVFMTVQ